MEDVIQFWADCDRFWEWIENPELTPESLEFYASTGILPKAKVVRPPRDFNEPPPGDFPVGSMWFHPTTGEIFVFNQGAWKGTYTSRLSKSVPKELGINLQEVKDVAKLYGIHSYYQSLTHQFKFSSGDKCWVETVDNLKTFTKASLGDYFSQFTRQKHSSAIVEQASAPEPEVTVPPPQDYDQSEFNSNYRLGSGLSTGFVLPETNC